VSEVIVVDAVAEVDRRIAEQRHAQTAWLCAYEQARAEDVDLSGWLKTHPYPTGDPKRAAQMRRMFTPAQ
jgi:hypothetical protein